VEQAHFQPALTEELKEELKNIANRLNQLLR